MNIERGKIHAPEIGRIWLNSPPLNLHMLRGRVALIDFWDYSCLNCLRTLPYLRAWHERYAEKGLVIIGVHTPEFTFGQYEANVERAVRELHLDYPVVLDSNYELWRAYANHYWPAKYLIDKDGYIRYAHYGEGAYAETEDAIQQLLREARPEIEFPPLMSPLHPEDSGATCERPTAELYLGRDRGKIGNPGGYLEGAAEYSFRGQPEEGQAYLRGHWTTTAEYVESAEDGANSILLKYSAAGVNAVLSPGKGAYTAPEAIVRQDDTPLNRQHATPDTQYRTAGLDDEETYLRVDRSRMYTLVNNGQFGTHYLELLCYHAGLRLYAFTFGTCVARESGEERSPAA